MVDATSLTSRLPPSRDLERRCIALAALDATLSPEWESRTYSFNRRWNPTDGTRMGSMRDGSGDEYFVLFFPDGAVALKGFAHESPALAGGRSIAGVLDELPAEFAAFAGEPAFSMDTTTFCLWNQGRGWSRSRKLSPATIAHDGSSEMLALLVGDASDYVEYARSYFEVDVSEDIVARFFNLEPLTEDLARALSVAVDLDAIAGDLDEIGYPSARARGAFEGARCRGGLRSADKRTTAFAPHRAAARDARDRFDAASIGRFELSSAGDPSRLTEQGAQGTRSDRPPPPGVSSHR